MDVRPLAANNGRRLAMVLGICVTLFVGLVRHPNPPRVVTIVLEGKLVAAGALVVVRIGHGDVAIGPCQRENLGGVTSGKVCKVKVIREDEQAVRLGFWSTSCYIGAEAHLACNHPSSGRYPCQDHL